jgi:hypothetical protein
MLTNAEAKAAAELLIDAAEHEMLATDDPSALERLKAEREELKATLARAEQRLADRRFARWVEATEREIRVSGDRWAAQALAGAGEELVDHAAGPHSLRGIAMVSEAMRLVDELERKSREDERRQIAEERARLMATLASIDERLRLMNEPPAPPPLVRSKMTVQEKSRDIEEHGKAAIL